MNDRSGRKKGRADEPELPPDLVAEGPRRRILLAALRLFAKSGFHGASIRDIVQIVEMPPSAVYAHFASKEHILGELARAGHETHHRALQTAVLDGGSDPVDQLRAYVRANALFHLQYPHAAKVVNGEMHALSGDLLAPALAIREHSAQLMFQILERGARTGRFAIAKADDDAAAFARGLHVTAGALGAMTLRLPYWFPTDGSFARDELADLQAELALRIVGAQKEPTS